MYTKLEQVREAIQAKKSEIIDSIAKEIEREKIWRVDTSPAITELTNLIKTLEKELYPFSELKVSNNDNQKKINKKFSYSTIASCLKVPSKINPEKRSRALFIGSMASPFATSYINACVHTLLVAGAKNFVSNFSVPLLFGMTTPMILSFAMSGCFLLGLGFSAYYHQYYGFSILCGVLSGGCSMIAATLLLLASQSNPVGWCMAIIAIAGLTLSILASIKYHDAKTLDSDLSSEVGSDECDEARQYSVSPYVLE